MCHRSLNLLWFALTFVFVTISCTPTKDTTNPTPSTKFDKEKILVLLKTGVKAKALESEFKAYSLRSKGQTSRSQNRFMFSFDKNSISPDVLLQKIKDSERVVEAVFPEVVREPRVSN